MRTGAYVAGDWGTSHLRLFLCAQDGEMLAQREGPGTAHLACDPAAFAQTISSLTAPWRQSSGALAVWLCGMVGSRIGWREAAYVPCPADASTLSRAMLRFASDGRIVWIAPGVECINARGAPDVMRGEETQILGAHAQYPQLAEGHRVVALPGTHMKWVVMSAGRINTFHTSFTGELYALLSEHSTLMRTQAQPRVNDEPFDESAFQQGLERARNLRATPLSHLLFESRSRQLRGEMSGAQAHAFLSGLIIGQDVLGALELFEAEMAQNPLVPLIGEPHLMHLYRLALAAHGLRALAIDASQATLAGLQILKRHVGLAEDSHAPGA